LTGKEYQMLELLSLRKGTTLTKRCSSIISTRYGRARAQDHRRVHLQAAQEARQRVERKNYIETVWGRGYVLREPADDESKISA